VARPIKENLIGKRFGRLSVIDRIKQPNHTRSIWKCLCDCGNETLLHTGHLTNNNTKSCGCYNKELGRQKVIDGIIGPQPKERGYAAMYYLYDIYRRNAKKRNYCWDLTIEDFQDITSRNCYYCGVEPQQISLKRKGNGHYMYNGIDRKDNNVGYTLQNSMPCCGICNRAKMSLDYNEFKVWIQRLIKYNKE
jgi:hypothetical protein